MSPSMRYLMDAKSVVEAVRHRLVTSGAVVELAQFDRLSASEMDLLVERERT